MDEQEFVIEIQDSAIDAAAILARIEAQVSRRRTESTYPQRLDEFPTIKATDVNDDYVYLPSDDEWGRTMGVLAENSFLSETQFTSSAPVVGILIVTIRKWWNWMSTKWYVLPLLSQQSKYNEQLLAAFYRLLQTQKYTQQQVDRLQKRIAKLEREQGGD